MGDFYYPVKNEDGVYQYPNANHAAAIDFEAYFGFFGRNV